MLYTALAKTPAIISVNEPPFSLSPFHDIMRPPKTAKSHKIKVRRRGTGAKKTKQQVKRNSEVVNKLLRTNLPITRYQATDTGVVTAQVHVNLITQPSAWTEVFRSYQVPDEDVPRSYQMNSLACKWCCQTESSASGNQWLQIFIVSLKPATAAKVIERTTRLSNLTKGLDYAAVDMGSNEPITAQGEGFYFLNPAFYTTHYSSGVRRIGQSTMDADTAVTNIRDSTTRGHANVKFDRVFKNDEYNAAGFRAIGYADVEPRNHLYMVMMSNATETSSIFLTANYIVTGRQATSQ